MFLEKDELKLVLEQRFYYTTNKPYSWNSGPVINYFNKDGDPIRDIEEAMELAAENEVNWPPFSEDIVQTSFGQDITRKYKYVQDE